MCLCVSFHCHVKNKLCECGTLNLSNMHNSVYQLWILFLYVCEPVLPTDTQVYILRAWWNTFWVLHDTNADCTIIYFRHTYVDTHSSAHTPWVFSPQFCGVMLLEKNSVSPAAVCIYQLGGLEQHWGCRQNHTQITAQVHTHIDGVTWGKMTRNLQQALHTHCTDRRMA